MYGNNCYSELVDINQTQTLTVLDFFLFYKVVACNKLHLLYHVSDLDWHT